MWKIASFNLTPLPTIKFDRMCVLVRSIHPSCYIGHTESETWNFIIYAKHPYTLSTTILSDL